MAEKPKFINAWVDQMAEIIMLEKPKTDEKKLREYLTKYAKEHIKVPNISLVNNYRNVCRRDNLVNLSELVMSGRVILGGDGNLYVQHKDRLAPLYTVIESLQDARNAAKAERKKYDEVLEFAKWLFWELEQTNDKTAVNALYGVLGYMEFPLFNVNLAQSITAMGQMIISTATCCFENFLSDNIKFVSYSELVSYIYEINKEYRKVKDRKHTFALVEDVTVKEVADRMIRKVGFAITIEETESMVNILSNLDQNCLKLVMYKNNFLDFNNTPFMRSFYKTLMGGIESLTMPDMDAFKKAEKYKTVCEPETQSRVEELLDLYQFFVYYDHPIFDKVRRTRYTNKACTLYTDTDSDFIGLHQYIDWVGNLMGVDILNDESFVNKCASICTMIISHIVTRNFNSFAASLNIAPEFRGLIAMKNEFFFEVIMFGLVKKRYLGLMKIREGSIIDEGRGKAEIKGFDFKKAGTKAFVRERFEKIIDEEIFHKKEIDPASIFMAFDNIKFDIRKAIENGDNMFYKQATVKEMDQYKAPFSNQASKSAIIWNIIEPDNKLELPAEVDIVPVNIFKGITQPRLEKMRAMGIKAYFEDPKNIKVNEPMYNFMVNFPDQFFNIWDGIITSSNPQIAKMTINVIAKPRYMTDIPGWFKSIIDDNKIIMDVVKLTIPLLEPLGFNVQSSSAKDRHYSNIIDI